MTITALLVFVSGACALIYQVVWVRQLVLVVGTTTAAVTTVLAVFMTGLGLGAWLLGSAADRSRAPLRLYAYLELGIGAYALALPWLIAASSPAYAGVARHLAGEPEFLLPIRVGLGFLLLLVPTVLMGGTLPVLIRYAGRNPERFGAHLGLLYGSNLAGGVVGSLAAGFLLIGALGVHGASAVAAAGNFAVGLGALLMASWTRRDAAIQRDVPSVPARLPVQEGARPLLWAAVFLSGLLTMAFETLWTRILLFSLGSTVHAFTVILAVFLTGLALGARLFVILERRARPLHVLAGALMAAGISAILLAPVSTRSQDAITALSSRFGWTGDVFLLGIVLWTALVVLIPATLMGLVLPLAMRLLVDDLTRAGRRVGTAYLVNTVGCVLGSLLAGFLLIPSLGLAWTLLLLCGVQMALGWAFLGFAERGLGRSLLRLGAAGAVTVTALVVGALLLRGPSPFDPALRAGAASTPIVEAHRDGIGASVSVLKYPNGERTLRIDGFEASSNKATAGYMALMTHIPVLLHPDPRRILVICFGTGTTAGAGILHPGVQVDVVDINRTVVEFAPHFLGVNHGVAGHPRARLVVDDGRNFLFTTNQRYDIITSEPMPPYYAGMVNLYSREYYELAREHLNPGGLVVQWLPMHLLTLDESLAILRTVQDVFPETTLWLHRDTGIIVASRDAPIRIDLARVARALGPGPLLDELTELGAGTPLDFARLHAMGPDEIRAATAAARSVTDDRPSLEFRRLRHPVQDYRGPYTMEHARMMSVIYRWRAQSVAPLAGASPAVAAEFAAWRKAASQQGLADVQRHWGLGS